MKEINLCYADMYNAGDLLNKDLVEKLSGKQVKRCKTYNADMIAIGGALFGLQYSNEAKRKFLQKLLSIVIKNKPLYVWGSGFLFNNSNNVFYRTNLKVCALRGKKTKEKLETITGKIYDVPLADAGLLIDMFLDEEIEKVYEMGVIPHMSQKNEAAFLDLCKKDGVHMIDIMQTPQQVIKEIAQCKCIVSSSLHGLIFADSLHIPSMHVLGEKELMGGRFKFDDYYSSFDVIDKARPLSEYCPTVEDVINNYEIDSEMVELKKKQLIECFPEV